MQSGIERHINGGDQVEKLVLVDVAVSKRREREREIFRQKIMARTTEIPLYAEIDKTSLVN